MAIRNLNAAENWDKVYSAFEDISFVSYDYNTVKSSLISYLRQHYSESFNDFIESSEMIAILELFAYVAEQLAYRVDMNSHENFITTAQRKQSILKMAKLISYNASRNLPPRGLVKITSISTTDTTLIDSQGNNISGNIVTWNDPNNPLWKEQFYLILNRVIVGKFGQPQKAFQVGDVSFQLYTFNNQLSSYRNGVYSYTADTGSETFPMEIVPVDVDSNGPLEKAPDINGQMGVLYADDGLGDGSDLTGFMMYTKQGNLSRIEYTFEGKLPNRMLELGIPNVNNTDIWVQQVDNNGAIIDFWSEVETVNAQNLYFAIERNRKKYEVETLENDKVKLIFGDGDFSDIPVGKFHIWTRQSSNKNIIIQKNRVVNQSTQFKYLSNVGLEETCSMTFSLTSTLQNGAASEDIEHIRQAAPTTYYAQGRMVNGQDYNTFMLRDPSILRLKTINRTFAGQPKYLDWHDASGQYENIKLFGDDLEMTYLFSQNSSTSTVSTRALIDMAIEPVLSEPGIISAMVHLLATHPEAQGAVTIPRKKFIESATVHEKNEIQGLLDSTFYGPAAGNQQVAPQPRIGLNYSPVRPMVGNGTFTFAATNNLDGTKFTRNETVTVELTSATTFAVTGSKIGVLLTGSVDTPYSEYGLQFTVAAGATPFEIGDAFIIDVVNNGLPVSTLRAVRFNLSGIWSTFFSFASGTQEPTDLFDPTVVNGVHNFPENSWLIYIKEERGNQGITGHTVTYRDLKLTVSSPTTKFWFNSESQILDSQTQNTVLDRISVLRSNLDNEGKVLSVNKIYDVIGDIKDNNGVANYRFLQVMPTDTRFSTTSGDGKPDNAFQFEVFANGTFKFELKPFNTSTWLPVLKLSDVPANILSSFASSPMSLTQTTAQGETYRRLPIRSKLDFMWQHFSPHTNLIDPSPSNIHDMYVLTSGYYDNVMQFLNNPTSIIPTPPTPLELRNQFSKLLNGKMLSDTVVLHSAKIKLLFGDLAAPQLRTKFRVVKAPTGTLTIDQIKNEILGVINLYFQIKNWDFGETFYATELLSLIHQRLPADIASVVMVPVYSTNSFGSLFTIESGIDEILQSAATISDIEIVDNLSPSVLRQHR